jgi:hypothetical protein
MKSRLFTRGSFAAISFLIVAGCVVRVSDRNQANGETTAALKRWGETIMVLHEMGTDLEKYASTAEILAEWEASGVFDTTDLGPFKHDYWGNPYRWETRRENGEIVIRIGSNGRNGIWENGEGDDLYLEISIPTNGKPKTHLKVSH